MVDAVTVLRNMQKQKAIGELNALRVSYYDNMGTDRELYHRVSKLITEIIEDLNNEIG